MSSTAVLLTLVLSAPLLHAQALTFGEPFPLTNTRYAPDSGQPIAVAGAGDFYLFWQAFNNLRVTRIEEGNGNRVGRHVLDSGGYNNAAAAWTGSAFFVVSTSPGGLIGQFVAHSADRIGEPFSVLVGPAGPPKVATNGRGMLVLHRFDAELRATALTSSGQPTGVRSTAVTNAGVAGHAVASNGNGYAAVVSTGNDVRFFTYDAEGREISNSVRGGPSVGHVDIASDGSGYLAAWQYQNGSIVAARVDADGTVHEPVPLEVPAANRSFTAPPSIAWNGTAWAVAYAIEEIGGTNRRLWIAYLDAAGRDTAREDAGAGFYPALAGSNGEWMMAWRPSLGRTPVMASRLPLAGRIPKAISFGATTQELLAAASAHDGNLVVWKETAGVEIRMMAGVRRPDGSWTERELLPIEAVDLLAASDGRDYAITGTNGSYHSFAQFVNATAGGDGTRIGLPFPARALAWTGSDYLILGKQAVVRLSRGGTLSEPVSIESLGIGSGIASNGATTMVVAIEQEPCPVLCPGEFGRVRFGRLGADLRPLEPPRYASDPGSLPDQAQVVWDGSRFLAAWASWDRVVVAELPETGEARIVAVLPADAYGLHLAAVEGAGAALSWRDSNNRLLRVASIASLRNDVVSLPRGYDTLGRPFVLSLTNGGIGLVDSTTNYAPPHQGSTRVMMWAGGFTPRAVPDPPRLTARPNGGISFEWTAPPQPVAAYRIQYRIGDGSWNELERPVLGRSAALSWTREPGVVYQFRVVAYGAAGASAPSNAITLNVPKRRSIRR